MGQSMTGEGASPHAGRGTPQSDGSGDRVTVGPLERWASLAGGGLLTLDGLSRFSPGELALSALGAGLLLRDATARCVMDEALRLSTAGRGTLALPRAGGDVLIERSVMVNRPPQWDYAHCRRFENLPRFMPHPEAVRVLNDRRPTGSRADRPAARSSGTPRSRATYWAS